MKLAVRGPQILANYLLDQIIYRDKNIIAINKPAFLPIHGPCRNEPISLKKFHGPTLAGLLSHFKFGNHHAPFIVHRLDKVRSAFLALEHDGRFIAGKARFHCSQTFSSFFHPWRRNKAIFRHC